MRLIPTILAGALLASPALALTSQDNCTLPCPQHQLQWRAAPADSWQNVGGPQDTVAGLSLPQVEGVFSGVRWSGIAPDVGEFRAKAIIGGAESLYSPVLVIEPPVAPTLLAVLGTLVFLRRRQRSAGGSSARRRSAVGTLRR